jgi:hypothetical protein
LLVAAIRQKGRGECAADLNFSNSNKRLSNWIKMSLTRAGKNKGLLALFKAYRPNFIGLKFYLNREFIRQD